MTNSISDNLWFFLLGEFCTVLVAVILVFLPIITRKDLFFGVRIPETVVSNPIVASMRNKYMIIMTIASLILMFIGLAIFLQTPKSAILLTIYQPTVIGLTQFAVYLPFWKQALKLKKDNGWKVGHVGISSISITSGKGRIKDMPKIWYVISVAFCILALLYSFYVYPSLPDVLIKHWDINMQPDSWAPKSIGTIIAMPIVSLSMIALMFGSNVALYYTKLQVSQVDPVLSFAQHRAYRRMMSHALGFLTMVMSLLFLLMIPMNLNIFIPKAELMMTVIFVFTALMIIPPVYVGLRAGQAGSKLKPVLSDAERKASEQYAAVNANIHTIDRGDDKYWKLGLFYVNPNDPSILVEDRFGSNGGLNYARPIAKFLAVIIVLLVILSYGASTCIFIFL